MPLPFEKDNNIRKYQCFICGVQHTDFDTFKQHIMDKHEEGREYVICPVAHCGAPVRDIKLHFKAKHRTIEMPKVGQIKALIWKDQTQKGKLKTRKPSFREGWFVSTKNHGKEFYYRSGWECEVYEALEMIDEVHAYDAEPFKDGIPYLFEGQTHHYHPDLSVQFIDGHVEIWEIKPSGQTALEKNQAKWRSANGFCQQRGWDFTVVTEQGIAKLKKHARKGQ